MDTGLRGGGGRSELTGANGRKGGLVVAVQPINKEGWAEAAPHPLVTVHDHRSDLHHPDAQRKTLERCEGFSVPISNGASPSPRPWTPVQARPCRTVLTIQQFTWTMVFGYFLI